MRTFAYGGDRSRGVTATAAFSAGYWRFRCRAVEPAQVSQLPDHVQHRLKKRRDVVGIVGTMRCERTEMMFKDVVCRGANRERGTVTVGRPRDGRQ